MDYSICLHKILALTTITLFSRISAIIVERNFHSYYKLPVESMNLSTSHSNKKLYHILQCPRQSSSDIPKPKEMMICTIVGQHEQDKDLGKKSNNNNTAGKEEDGKTSIPKNKLHTKVDFSKLKPITPAASFARRKPCIIVLQTVKPTQNPYSDNVESFEAKSEKDKTVKAANDLDDYWDYRRRKRLLLPTKDAEVKTKMLNGRKFSNSPSIKLSSMRPIASMRRDSGDTATDQHFINKSSIIPSEEDEGSSYEESDSPLKHLSVKDAIKKLIERKIKNITSKNNFNEEPNSREAQDFFDEHLQYNKGDHRKAYQNYYHRDEYVNDQVFYDDFDGEGYYSDSRANITHK